MAVDALRDKACDRLCDGRLPVHTAQGGGRSGQKIPKRPRSSKRSLELAIIKSRMELVEFNKPHSQ